MVVSMQRFVNLVSHAINLCELQPKSGEIKYPNIQSHTEIFALEVKKTIESKCHSKPCKSCSVQ